MPFKTPGKTSEYIRELISLKGKNDFVEIAEYADLNYIPVLLPETVAFLKQIIALKQPKNILEIGTAIGYSGLIMLSGCNARLHTIEIEEELVETAKRNFSAYGFKDRVTIFCGDACEIVPIMQGKFDFVLLDGPKTRYIEFYPFLREMIVKGGILFCDNVLYNGMVSGEEEIGHKKNSIVEKLDLFLKTLFGDDEFDSSLLPVGDGISLSIKK